jgi:hypothetical protein
MTFHFIAVITLVGLLVSVASANTAFILPEPGEIPDIGEDTINAGPPREVSEPFCIAIVILVAILPFVFCGCIFFYCWLGLDSDEEEDDQQRDTGMLTRTATTRLYPTDFISCIGVFPEIDYYNYLSFGGWLGSPSFPQETTRTAFQEDKLSKRQEEQVPTNRTEKDDEDDLDV